MSTLFAYYRRPPGVGPDGLVAALRAAGLELEWQPLEPDEPGALAGRLFPSGRPDAETLVTVAEQEMLAFERDEIAAELPGDTSAGARSRLEEADAILRVTPRVGEDFDAVRAAVLATVTVARASNGLIQREGDSIVYTVDEYLDVEPLARGGDAP